MIDSASLTGWTRKHGRNWFLAAIVVFIATACAANGVSSARSAESVISERAAARWEARVAGDLDAAYAFESPAYRDAHSVRLYRSRFGSQLRWTDAKVMEVSVSDDVASVRVMVSYVTMDPAGRVAKGERPLEEVWIRVGGEWWHSGR